MESIKKTTVVPFSPEQMYDLVNDVRAYPTFLPWCSQTEVHEENSQYMKASVSLAAGGVKQTFTTANTLTAPERIDVELVAGPFRQLRGFWLFEPAGEGMCRVNFQMNFEYKNRVIKLALNRIFQKIGESLVSSFVERAHQVYDKG